jgi:lysophospholipase L1-like esterase
MRQLIRPISALLITFAILARAHALAQSTATKDAPAPQSTATSTQQPATADGKVNTAVVPQLRQGFMGRHESFVEIAKQGNIDVLFMGDSITDWWRSDGRGFGRRGRRGAPGEPTKAAEPVQPVSPAQPAAENENRPNAGKPVFDKYFGSWKVANFGIAGDTTQGVLWRLQNGEGQGFQPKAVMLMIGTNNTGGGRGGGNTAEEIADGVKAVVAELRKDFPNAKILLLGIFPRSTPDSPVRAKIKEINTIIAKLHDGENVTYMDIGDKFLAEDGTIPRDVMADGLHPTTKGYEIWAEAVKEPLEKMLSSGAAPR